MTVVLARVDNRLIHGQVLEGWIPRINASVIVVADDSVANDSLRQAIMEIAVPSRIKCRFLHIQDLRNFMDKGSSDSERVIILFSEIQYARDAIEGGVALACLNIGNVHYEHGKRRITPSVSLDEQEICWLDEIDRRIPVDIRATPDDSMKSLSELIENANHAAGVTCPAPSRGWRGFWPFRIFRQ